MFQNRTVACALWSLRGWWYKRKKGPLSKTSADFRSLHRFILNENIAHFPRIFTLILLHIWKSIGSLLVKGNFYIRNITSTKRLLHEDVRHIGTSQPDMPYSFLYECRKLAPPAACQPTAHRLAWHATCRATDRQSGEKGQVSERCQSDRHLFLKESVGWGSCHIQGSL